MKYPILVCLLGDVVVVGFVMFSEGCWPSIELDRERENSETMSC